MQSLIPKTLTAPALNASHIQRGSKVKVRAFFTKSFVWTKIIQLNENLAVLENAIHSPCFDTHSVYTSSAA